MAQTTILILIPTTAHAPGTSPETVEGSAVQAAAYYLANRDLQTISWNFSSTFIGDCVIQASLVTSPTSSDWTDVYTIDVASTKNGFTNLNGNFVWLRAVVSDWTQGQIQQVTVSY
jgi:hypothetical protein